MLARLFLSYGTQDLSIFRLPNSAFLVCHRHYKEAQKALKTEEEQTFSEKEIDVMLPNSVRRENRKVN